MSGTTTTKNDFDDDGYVKGVDEDDHADDDNDYFYGDGGGDNDNSDSDVENDSSDSDDDIHLSSMLQSRNLSATHVRGFGIEKKGIFISYLPLYIFTIIYPCIATLRHKIPFDVKNNKNLFMVFET